MHLDQTSRSIYPTRETHTSQQAAAPWQQKRHATLEPAHRQQRRRKGNDDDDDGCVPYVQASGAPAGTVCSASSGYKAAAHRITTRNRPDACMRTPTRGRTPSQALPSKCIIVNLVIPITIIGLLGVSRHDNKVRPSPTWPPRLFRLLRPPSFQATSKRHAAFVKSCSYRTRSCTSYAKDSRSSCVLRTSSGPTDS